MPSERGFGDDGTQATRFYKPHEGDDHMNENYEDVVHLRIVSKTSKGLLASALSTQCWLCSLLWLPECRCLEFEWLCLGGLLLDLGRLRCFRGRRAMA